ncbi:zinc finger CCCH domain-containing protein 11-like isoform X2 [Andrographis paniculata]|uniref:zinc finger CCCH domain-containing protein 11-like isoform X2 n=1 Tax=Andrographis paniculata TaxID=175694 RepID=UPI0021E92326|nr:zinc finger CCCH domain-containing protein 11-like isoform X2 [Andrographis paniculata]
MPPKQQSKADLAKKQKIIEDKTFGLKNKNKSKNVQKYVQSLKQSVQPKPDPKKVDAKKKIEEEKAKERELNELFKVAVKQPKVPVGVDPKSIVCEHFKVGQCAKGFKCKFSHDLNVQRKGEKIDIYTDKRDQETMEDWDQEMLEKVVESKSKEYNKNKPTDIVCKYFLEAVEKKQYGWFWVCPNGGKDCHYRHALPPGYLLKSQMKALLEEESEKIPIEEEIENQRAKISTATPMTPELFMQWKKKKVEDREERLAAQSADRAKNDRMSGRELFLSDSSIFVDDVGAYDKYLREEEPFSNEKVNKDLLVDRPASSASTRPSSSASTTRGAENDADDNVDDLDDNDDLDIDELNELEASLTRTTLTINEPGNTA